MKKTRKIAEKEETSTIDLTNVLIGGFTGAVIGGLIGAVLATDGDFRFGIDDLVGASGDDDGEDDSDPEDDAEESGEEADDGSED